MKIIIELNIIHFAFGTNSLSFRNDKGPFILRVAERLYRKFKIQDSRSRFKIQDSKFKIQNSKNIIFSSLHDIDQQD